MRTHDPIIKVPLPDAVVDAIRRHARATGQSIYDVIRILVIEAIQEGKIDAAHRRN